MYTIQAEMTERKRAMVRDGHTIRVRTPADVATECGDIANSSQEIMMVLLLNSKNMLLDKKIATVGLLDSTLVSPREIFRDAIISQAAACVLIHNHPSGENSPSSEDIRITKQMVEAGKTVDIKVLDHVILSANDVSGGVCHFSMRESGLVQF